MFKKFKKKITKCNICGITFSNRTGACPQCLETFKSAEVQKLYEPLKRFAQEVEKKRGLT